MNTENQEALLQKLALRLSTFPGDPRVSDPKLLVGQLPNNLSFELPVPERTRVLGSLVRSQEHIDIVLDSDLSPEQALDFYKARLLAAGWSEQETMRPHHGGFAHSGFPMFDNHITFCRGPHGPAFTVNAYTSKNERTDIRLDLNASSEHSPCAQPNRIQRRMMHRDLYDLVPMLMPPKGATQMGGGGGGGPDNWYSSATLTAETDIDLTVLASHYTTQLEKSGWTRSDEGQDGPLAWSTWTFQDEEKEPWRGLFFILKVPGRKHEYALEVRINWDKEDDKGGGMRLTGGGGWFSYAPLGSF